MRKLDRLTKLWHGEGPNLNVGCGHLGTCIQPPFINLDIEEYEDWKVSPHSPHYAHYTPYKFVIGDARKLEYPNNHFWVIFASELIEHFPYSDSVGVLKEFYRTLKPDGCLKVCCPDFKFVVEEYLGTSNFKYLDYDMGKGLLMRKNREIVNRRETIFSVLYGARTIAPDGTIYMDHMTIWDEEFLKYWLERIGFKDVERVPDKSPWAYPTCNARDLCMEAWK